MKRKHYLSSLLIFLTIITFVYIHPTKGKDLKYETNYVETSQSINELFPNPRVPQTTEYIVIAKRSGARRSYRRNTTPTNRIKNNNNNNNNNQQQRKNVRRTIKNTTQRRANRNTQTNNTGKNNNKNTTVRDNTNKNTKADTTVKTTNNKTKKKKKRNYSEADKKLAAKAKRHKHKNRKEALKSFKEANKNKYPTKYDKEPATRPDHIPRTFDVGGGVNVNINYDPIHRGYGYRHNGIWVDYDPFLDVRMSDRLMYINGYVVDDGIVQPKVVVVHRDTCFISNL